METLHWRPQSFHLMNSVLFFSKLKPNSLFKPFSTGRSSAKSSLLAVKTSSTGSRKRPELGKLNHSNEAEAARQLKENWLNSLSCPFPQPEISTSCDGFASDTKTNVGSNWVIGVDPDLCGALALLKFDDSGCSPMVVDSPHLKVLVGNKIRKRLDVKSIVQLLRSFDVPIGTTAYIEQSTPYPQDGKQGWWSGGFGYGLWIGTLVASGFSVVPVPSVAWKNEFELSGSKISKDDSRKVASVLFPSLSELLKRKKDHGRAEALLIAAYGNGMKLKNLEELPQIAHFTLPPNLLPSDAALPCHDALLTS